jgi:hypothetical protein
MKAAVKVLLVLVLAVLVFAMLSLPRLAWASMRTAMMGPRIALANARVAAIQPHLIAHLPERIELEHIGEIRTWRGEFPLQGPDGDKLVMGGTFTLDEGESLNGNLVVMGGIAKLRDGSLVEGDVVVLGGTVSADGEIEGNVVAIGGLIELGSDALVEGDVVTVGGHVERDDGAVVEGNVVTGFPEPFPIVIPGVPGDISVPSYDMHFNPVWDVLRGGLWVLLRSFLWAVVAVLVVLFLPDHSERVAQTAVGQPLITGGLGLMTAIVAPILLVVIAITIIGIPVSLVGAFLLAVAWTFGVIALSMEVGKRLARMLNQEWALAVSAGVGAFLLTLVMNGVAELVSCIGWILPALIGMVGLGAVILTRFGTQYYPPEAPVAPQAPAAPLPPAAPPASPAATMELPPEAEGETGESDNN